MKRVPMALSGVFKDHGPMMPVRLHGPKGYVDGVALIDTGARRTAVDTKTAERLGAPVLRTFPINSSCGTCSQSLVGGHLQIGGERFEPQGGLLTTSTTEIRPDCVALIGRDFLRRGTFSMDANSWTFTPR